MKRKVIFLVVISLLLALVQTSVLSQTNKIATSSSQPQGLGPFAIEVTQDGQYAYLGFDLSEVIFKIRLSDLSIVAMADLAAYFPVECEQIALDASEKKLFVYTPTWRKLLVLDTDTMSLIHTIDDYGVYGMFRSQFGSRLITWNGGSVVQFVDTNSYTVTQHDVDDLFILKVQEYNDDQNKLYAVTQGLLGGQGPLTVGLYDLVTGSWINSVTFPQQSGGEGIFDLRVLPNGQKAFVATFGGWYPDYRAYGWLYAIDLVTHQVAAVPIDGGAMSLAVNQAGTQLYVGTGWPQPITNNNILVVDTVSNNIMGSIPLGRNSYGWPYSQVNEMQNDPAHSNVLYATSTDGNAIIKIDIDSLTMAGVRVLNKESIQPHFFVRRQQQAFGNILIQHSSKSFELNLNNATIQNLVSFPAIRPDVGMYDIGVLTARRLLIAQGEYLLEVDPQGMQLIATHPLPPSIPAIWWFVLSNDNSKIYTVTYSEEKANLFLAINTTNFQVINQLILEGGNFEFRPFELPDGSKLYALGGLQNGPVVVQVIGTTDYTVQKTITYDQPGRLGISTGPSFPYAYDPVSRTLFVGATNVVLAIDTNTDVIKQVISLGDVATAIGLQPWQFTYLNAVGLVYNPSENFLYIAHADRGFLSIYDLTNNHFLPTIISLQGFFPNCLFTNDAHDRLYTINSRSDSVSVVDVASKTVEKVIDLHDYMNEVFLPVIFKSTP